MEYALLHNTDKRLLRQQYGLNLCSNGICSLTNKAIMAYWEDISLNPCSNGICSLTRYLLDRRALI